MLTRYLLFLSLYLVPVFSTAQSLPDSSELQEIVVSVNKEVELKKNIAQQVTVITGREIKNAQAATTADLLSSYGIPVQRSQLGGGSPMLRGFEASRILLVLDGVRLNNLIYRAGHLQDIIKTDNNMLERVEVLFGPASTVYGSDALGGVVHLFTRKPEFATTGGSYIKGEAFSRFSSAANAWTHQALLQAGRSRLASLTAFTYSHFGDLRSGRRRNLFYDTLYGLRPHHAERIAGRDTLLRNNSPWIQRGSGYTQYDFLQKISWQTTALLTQGLNLQYSTTSNIPRYDRLTDPATGGGLRSAEWFYGPQERLLLAYDLDYKPQGRNMEGLHAGLSYQYLEESRHNRNFGSTFRNSRIEHVGVFGANVDLRHRWMHHDVRTGLDVQYNMLQSTAERTNIKDGSKAPLDTRYPDGDNQMLHAALYASHTWQLQPNLQIVDGLRVGIARLHSSLVDTALLFHLPFTEINQNNLVYSGNAGFIYFPQPSTKLALLVSTGFRVPNVDDLSKIFESAPGRVIVPNPQLKPERTFNYELSLEQKWGRSVTAAASVFYTDYNNITVVDRFNLNDADSIYYDGAKSAVYANQNKDKAYLYGFSAQVRGNWDKHWFAGSMLQYTYGRLRNPGADSPLDHIPPVQANAFLNYDNRLWSAGFTVIYNGWKRIENYSRSGEDNEQYATPGGMPAWVTLNLRVSRSLSTWLTAQAGVDNLLDMQYRTFASGINAPGRNLVFTLRAKF